MKKKRIVTNDKSKIAAIIKELDEKKNEALRNAWQKVNKVSFFERGLNLTQGLEELGIKFPCQGTRRPFSKKYY